MNLDPTRAIGENSVPAAERFDDHGRLLRSRLSGLRVCGARATFS